MMVRDDLQMYLLAVWEQLVQLHALEADLAQRLAYAQAHPDPECVMAGCVYLGPPALDSPPEGRR